MKKEIMQKLAELADILDSKGFLAEADAVDAVTKEVSEEDLSNEEIVERLNEGPWVSLPKSMVAGRIIINKTDRSFYEMAPEDKKYLEDEAEHIRRNSKIIQVGGMGPSEYFVLLNPGLDKDPEALFLAAYRQFGFGGHITRLYPDKEGRMRYVVTTNTLD